MSLSVNADWLTPEILWKLGRVSDPQLSPDGSKFVYNIRSYSIESNKGNSDIWIYDFTTNTASALAKDSSNESSAKWSSDGKHIYYLDDKGSSQVWRMNSDGSGKIKVSNVESDVNAYGISANGNMIWMTRDVKLDNFFGKDKYPDLPKTTGRVFDDLMMRHWDQWADGTYSHVFIATLDGEKLKGQPVDVMATEHFDSPLKPDGDESEISWSADGKFLAYTSKKSTGKQYATETNSEIYVYDVATSKTKNISQGLGGYDKSPVFSPDGKSIAWINYEEAANEASSQRLFLADLQSGEKKNLTGSFDFNVQSPQWANSGKIYFTADKSATVQLFYTDPSNPAAGVSQVTDHVADINSFSVSTISGNDKIVAARMSISAPTEVFSIDGSNGAETQLTFTNKSILEPLTLGEVKKMMVGSSDGKEILTWVIYPPNFNPKNKYPTLLYCQGGPQSTVSQFFSYRWNFQLMAANGYIVVAPNRRGLPGFGKEWNDQISTDWGGQAMNDLLSAIDTVSKEPYVNKEKLGAVGPSFGGYSVFWLEGHHQRRFKAMIAHCGVFNLESMLATEELFFHLYEFDGAYWRVPRPVSYEKFSPHNFVQNWNVPILIIANEKDYRVPYTQGLEAYSAARLKNIPARFLSFPDEGHWVLKPQNALMWQREFFGWLDKYLK